MSSASKLSRSMLEASKAEEELREKKGLTRLCGGGWGWGAGDTYLLAGQEAGGGSRLPSDRNMDRDPAFFESFNLFS